MTDQTPTTIAFVLFPGLTPLDLVGPLQVMAGLETLEEMLGITPGHRAVVVAEHVEPVDTDTPLLVAATATFADVPAPDVVVVPGGGVPALRQLANDTLLDYLRQVDRGTRVTASVCTGALILAGAGLLAGRRATTHWGYYRLLERLGATYVTERWVEDGKYLTAAGVSAGIDAALRLVARLTSDEIAKAVQLGIEYDPQPPHGAIDWTRVDRDVLRPRVESSVKEALADDADLLERLLG